MTTVKIGVAIVGVWAAAGGVYAGSVDVSGRVQDASGATIYGGTARLYCGSYSYGGSAADTETVYGGTFYLYASRYSGPAVVTVDKPGYGTWRARWEASQLATYASLSVTSVLAEACIVSGRVQNAASEPVSNAVIRLDWRLDDGVTEYEAVSDTEGRYAVTNVGVGSYTARLVPPAGYAAQTTTVALVESGGSTLDFTVEESARLTGVVSAQTGGAPLTNVTVKVIGRMETQATTDTNGVYVIGELASGDYTVVAAPSGYCAYTGTVTLAAAQTLTNNIALLRPAKLTVRVSGPDGGRTYGSAVGLLRDTEDTSATWSGSTDASGFCTLSGIVPGERTIRVTDPYYAAYTAPVSLSDGGTVTQEVALSAAIRYTGQIRERNADAHPIEGVAVDLYRASVSGQVYRADTTDAFGRFLFSNLETGDYRLTATHPGYTPVETNFTVDATADGKLSMEPLPEPRFDLYVQVNCALSGMPVDGTAVSLDVLSLPDGGDLLHEETRVTDVNGTLCFRGVPQGYVRFQANLAAGAHRGWWKEFVTEREYAANAKMVNLNLEPKKGSFTVDIDPPYDWMQGIAVYVQNFWVEVQGYDNGSELYPARTGITDKDGKYTFERVPCLPTRITVRRPGFAPKETLLTPTDDGSFPLLVTLARPSNTTGTGFSLSLQQPVFTYLSGTTSIPIQQSGLPNSNTEGFDDTWSLDRTTSLPFSATTSYGPRSPWGCGTYALSCRVVNGKYATGQGYVMSRQYFDFAFRFPPQQVFLKEGSVTTNTIQAEVVPALYHGTLLAAESVSEFGEPLYRPVTNAEVRFVIHTNVVSWFTSSNRVHTATTDENGCYVIAVPPGVYGIEIPSLPGYWGEKVIRRVASGSPTETGWPYAFNKPSSWSSYAYDSSYVQGYGMRVNSQDEARLDLVVRKQIYHLRVPVAEGAEIRRRIVFAESNGNTYDVETSDLLESETELTLSDGADTFVALVQRDHDGPFAAWTNLPPATYTFVGDSHDYLETSYSATFACFDWGAYPGAQPASEPPYSTPEAVPLPAHVYTGSTATFQDADSASAAVTVIYSGENGLDDYQTVPSFVRYAEWPQRVFAYGGAVDDARVQCFYVPYDGKFYQANRSGGGWVANTTGVSASLNLSPFALSVVARQVAAQDVVVPELPFSHDGGDYVAPHQFASVSGSAELTPVAGSPSAWSWESIHYDVCVTGSTAAVRATIFAAPIVALQGSVVSAATGDALSNATVRILRADGGDVRCSSGGTYASGCRTGADGAFQFAEVASGLGPYMLETRIPGYLPVRTRLVLGDLITSTNSTAFGATLSAPVALQPVAMTLALDQWNRHGAVLHSVKVGGTANQEATAEAVSLQVGASAAIAVQTYPLQDFDASDGVPGGVRNAALADVLDELVVVDARRKDESGNNVPLLPADGADYYPQSATHLPRPNDPAGIDAWLRSVMLNGGFFRKTAFAGRTASGAVTGLVNVAEFPAGAVNPVLVATTRNGACAILPLGTNLLYSVGLPRWLAFSADLFAAAATVQGSYTDLKETYASKLPDGKLSALPKLSGGISEENGYLTYTYGLGVAWKEGDEAPGEGGLGIGPGLLGLEFEATASVGFSGETSDLSFTVGGTVSKNEIDLSDYMPGFGKAMGLEGSINSVGGTAETKHSGQYLGGDWAERELETIVGAYLDLTIRYNLEGITGKIPYVGPFITAADKTGLLKLYARLDAGGRVESKERWRTVEQERKPVGAGDDYEYPSGIVIIPPEPDADPLTPSRHAFGGTRDTTGTYTNQFSLGMTFATSFEGSGLGDHLYLRTGLEITGNESDLVAGKPSLVIIPNTFGDWPPIKRVSGDVNAFANAKLDAYVTEIEKTWTMNLARIDHQFTTDSLMTMTDLNIAVTERERVATAFTGAFPVLVRNLPKGSSFAVGNGWVIFGRYDDATHTTELVVSLFDGTTYGEPTALATVEGLGRMRLADLGGGRWLLVWEEHPGIASNPSATSVLRAAFYDAGAWGAPHTAVALDGYLTTLDIFASRDKLSIPYVESYESNDSTNARIRAVVYGGSGTAWSVPYNIRSSAVVLDAAMACAGAAGDAVWSDEPGRIFYVQSNSSVSSRYWDGERYYVPGKADYVYITAGPVKRVAMCPAGTNDALYAALLESDGEIRLRRYVPDATRDPANLDYNWNGLSVNAMWPELGVFADGADGASELACGWLAQTNLLLTVWARNGLLHAAFTDPNQVSNSVLCQISSNGSGQYSDIRIEPVSNATARIYACYRSETLQELRVFTVSADGGVTGPNPDANGSFTLIYLAGAGGTVDGVTTQQVAQGESGSAVVAAGADTDVVFRAWSDGNTSATRTDADVQSNLTVTARFRSAGGADLDWYSAYGFAPEGGELWSALDARTVSGKGTTLLHEFIADTDPNDANSIFRVEAVDPGPPVTVSFSPGSTERNYTLQFVDDLIGGVWSNVPGQGPRSGAGGTDTMTDTGTAPARFYRVKVEVP